MELYDAVHWAVHIVHSETVAVNACNIWGDQLIPNSGGIVIDGSRRVYLGGNIISTADNAITVKTTSGTSVTGALTSCCIETEDDPHCAFPGSGTNTPCLNSCQVHTVPALAVKLARWHAGNLDTALQGKSCHEQCLFFSGRSRQVRG